MMSVDSPVLGKESPEQQSRQHRQISAAGRAALEAAALMALVVVAALQATMATDLVFGDEVSYLAAGLRIGSEGTLPEFTSGALYSDLYYLVSFVASDDVGLYFAMRAFTAVTLVVGVWVSARLLAGPVLAWSVAAVATALPVTYVWPGVAGPSSALVLISLAVLVRWRSIGGMSAGVTLVWIGSGFRPELAWLAALMSALLLMWLAVQVKSTRANLQAVWGLLAAVGVPVGLWITHGALFATSRSWVAFSQHFALRNATQEEDPWLDAAAVVARSFPRADSLGGAAMQSPVAFGQHVAHNVADGLVAITKSFFGLIPLPSSPLGAVMSLTLVTTVLVSMLVDTTGTRSRLRQATLAVRSGPSPAWWIVPTAVVLAAVMTLVPILLIYPREHYLVLPTAMMLVLAAVALHQLGSRRVTRYLPILVLVGLFALSSVQTLRATFNRVVYPASVARSVALMGQSGQEWTVLSEDWGANAGLKTFVPGVEIVQMGDRREGESLGAFIAREGVNAIWRPRDIQDAELTGWLNGVDDPTRAGSPRLAPIFPGSVVFIPTGSSE